MRTCKLIGRMLFNRLSLNKGLLQAARTLQQQLLLFLLPTGTPPKPEPVGVEQLSGAEAARLDASRAAGRDTTEHSGRSIGDAAAAKVQQARGAAPPAGDAVDVSRLQVRQRHTGSGRGRS